MPAELRLRIALGFRRPPIFRWRLGIRVRKTGGRDAQTQNSFQNLRNKTAHKLMSFDCLAKTQGRLRRIFPAGNQTYKSKDISSFDGENQ